MPHHPTGTELPLRTREIIEEQGEARTQHTVFCPAQRASVDVEGTCHSCSYCESAPANGDTTLRCTHPAAPVRAGVLARAPWVTSKQTAVREVMTRDVACVTPGLAIEAFASLLLERNISAAPVVDERGRAIGIASKTDLVRWYLHEEELEGPDDVTAVEPGLSVRTVPVRTVNDLMTPLAFTLGEEAALSVAAALMTMEGAHHLPIVDAAGEVVGIISSLDLARWIAQRDGLLSSAGK